MKKIFYFVLSVILGIFVLTGCGISDIFKDDPETTSLTGILTEQTAEDTTTPGTHLLKTDDQTTVNLRSVSINLSNDQYLNNKVKVLGVRIEKDNVFEVTGVSVVEILQEITKKGDKVTYKNSKLGFELKYYNDWDIEESPAEVTFSKGEDSGKIIIGAYKGEVFDSLPAEIDPNAKIPENFFLNIKDLSPAVTSREDLTESVIGLDQLDAAKVENDGQVDYFVYRNSLDYSIYQITYFPASSEQNEDELRIFNEMVAEFKFIGINEPVEESTVEEDLPIADIKMTPFESLPYHFTAAYPSSWYYAGISGSAYGESGVLHHYGFGEESPVGTENELVTLDVISGSLPSGENVKIGDKNAVMVLSGDKVNYYLTLENQNYRVSGAKEHKDILMLIVNSISAAKNEETP